MFERDGFFRAKIVDIMREADRATGLFYLHYKGKHDVLGELLEEFQGRLKEEIHRPFISSEGPLENLQRTVATFWRLYRADWAIVTAAFQLAMVDDAFGERWRAIRAQGVRAMTRVVKVAQRQGWSPGLDAELTASALCSMFEFSCYNWTVPNGDFKGKRISDGRATKVLTELAVHALGWRSTDGPER